MSVWHSQRMYIGFMTFAVAMVGLAVWAWLRYGASLVTAVAVAIAIACVAAMFCVWWFQQRALRSVNEAIRSAKRYGQDKVAQDDKGKR